MEVGTTVTTLLAPVAITLAANGAGTVYIYYDPATGLSAAGNAPITCASPCTVVPGVTAFPPGTKPLWTWQAINGTWLVDGGTDLRAWLSIYPITCAGNLLLCTNTGSTVMIQANINFVDGEMPVGAVDGTNAAFVLANTPIPVSLRVYVGGLRMQNTTYTLSGNTITFTTSPAATSSVLVDYRW